MKKMSQNIGWYFAEKCFILYLLSTFCKISLFYLLTSWNHFILCLEVKNDQQKSSRLKSLSRAILALSRIADIFAGVSESLQKVWSRPAARKFFGTF